jgi:indole-3-glycerol phosphate synthase
MRFFAILVTVLLPGLQAYISRSTNRFQKSTTELSAKENARGLYLERMVERKKIEVNQLLKRHQSPDDPLVMRMSYMASECKYNVTKSLKREADGKQGLHTMSVMVDMKRRSPTVPEQREIVDFSNAAKFAELLTLAGTDAFLINTDELEYGGKFSELKECAKSTKLIRPQAPPACIMKDIIIHPVQVSR